MGPHRGKQDEQPSNLTQQIQNHQLTRNAAYSCAVKHNVTVITNSEQFWAALEATVVYTTST